MLAAAADQDSALGLFQLALRSIESRPAVEISDAIKQHVVDMLRASLEIAADPKTINANTPPEAIELALRLRGHSALAKKVGRINAFDNLRGELAQELLRSLRVAVAP